MISGWLLFTNTTLSVSSIALNYKSLTLCIYFIKFIIKADETELNRSEKRKQIECESIFEKNSKKKSNSKSQSMSLSLSFDSGSKKKLDKHQSQIDNLKKKLNHSIKEKILVNNNLSDFKMNSNMSKALSSVVSSSDSDNKLSSSLKLNLKTDDKIKPVKVVGLVSNDYDLESTSSDFSDHDSETLKNF